MTESPNPTKQAVVRIVVDDLKRIIAPPMPGLQLLMALKSVNLAFFLNGVASLKQLPKGGMVRINSKDDLQLDSTSIARVLSISLSGDLVVMAATLLEVNENAGDVSALIKSRIGFMDSTLANLLRLLKDSLDDPSNMHYAKSTLLGQVIALHLIDKECLAGCRRVCKSGGLSDQQMECLKKYVEENLDGDLRDATLARTVGLSVASLRKRFKVSFGRSPREYVIDERIRSAIDLLESTCINIGTIAHQCGFADHSHMCLMLRKHVGRTPGQVRGGR